VHDGKMDAIIYHVMISDVEESKKKFGCMTIIMQIEDIVPSAKVQKLGLSIRKKLYLV
jgi:hypothetical protein